MSLERSDLQTNSFEKSWDREASLKAAQEAWINMYEKENALERVSEDPRYENLNRHF